MSNQTTTQNLSFKVHSFKNNESPDLQLTYHTMFVDITDLPKKIDEWREINTRDYQERSRPFRGMLVSLEENPERFIYKNRGMTIIADEIYFDNKSKSVRLTFSDKEHNGLLDGGHTFGSIVHFLEANPSFEKEKAYVKIEVITGPKTEEFNTDVVEIVRARNTALGMKEQGFLNLAKAFEPIKERLIDKPYSNLIHYKQHEHGDKPIDIKEILSYLLCFDVLEYQDSSEQPIIAYSGKETVVKKFSDDNSREQIYKNLDLLPEILNLHDYLYKNIPFKWNKSGGHFGGLKFVKEKEVTLYFTEQSADYSYPKALLYPILAAFRANVKKGNGSWKLPIEELISNDDLIVKLVGTVRSHAAEHGNEPNKVGKAKSIWQTCYMTVDSHIKDEIIKKYE